MYVCMYVCMYMSIYKYIYRHTRLRPARCRTRTPQCHRTRAAPREMRLGARRRAGCGGLGVARGGWNGVSVARLRLAVGLPVLMQTRETGSLVRLARALRIVRVTAVLKLGVGSFTGCRSTYPVLKLGVGSFTRLQIDLSGSKIRVGSFTRLQIDLFGSKIRGWEFYTVADRPIRF